MGTNPQTETLREALSRRYRHQAWAFDGTRGPILLRRRWLPACARPGDHVLEVGCGTGRLLASLCRAVGPRGSVFGIEGAAAMARRAERRARQLPVATVVEGIYPDVRPRSPVDLVVFSYSLSMMPNPSTALAAAATDLRPGGRVAILDFVQSRWPWMQRLIASAGVDLHTDRAALAAEDFAIQQRSRHSGYGLWSYELLLGSRSESRTEPI